MSNQIKFTLSESDLPKRWYNINADMPVPPNPVLHPGTMEPVTPDFLSVLFPMELILQEISTDQYIDIPEEVRDVYKLYRPTPLLRATRLEKALGTPAHIYYKYEGVSPWAATSPTPPSHKLFTTRLPAPRRSPPRPAPGSGAPRWLSPGSSSTLLSKCIWSKSATSKSRIAAF
jgi:predicted alternative tryptophan synthase beta-subunit